MVFGAGDRKLVVLLGGGARSPIQVDNEAARLVAVVAARLRRGLAVATLSLPGLPALHLLCPGVADQGAIVLQRLDRGLGLLVVVVKEQCSIVIVAARVL